MIRRNQFSQVVVLLLAALLALAGCSSSSSSNAGADTSTGADTNAGVDTSTGADTSAGVDSNVSPDTQGGPDLNQPPTGLTTAWETENFVELKKLYEVFETKQLTFWDGQYQLQKIPTYIVVRDPQTMVGIRGFLLHHPSPPADAKLLSPGEAGGLTDVYRWDGEVSKVTTEFTFEFLYPINGVECYVMPFVDMSKLSGGDPFARDFKDAFFRLFFIHEGFHRFQAKEGMFKNELQASTDQLNQLPLTQELVELSLLEHAILAAGLKATDKTAKEKYLAQFYAVRRTRMDLDTSSEKLVNLVDNGQEMIEGTALYLEYVFFNAAGMAYDGDIRPLDELLANYNTMDGSPKSFIEESLRTARQYQTGAALGLLLDAVGNTTWHKDLQGGTYFVAVISQSLNIQDADIATLLSEAKGEHNFVALQEMAKKYLAAQ